MDVTKPCKFIGSGAMDVTKPYKCIDFGAMDVTKPPTQKRKTNTKGSGYPCGPIFSGQAPRLCGPCPGTATLADKVFATRLPHCPPAVCPSARRRPCSACLRIDPSSGGRLPGQPLDEGRVGLDAEAAHERVLIFLAVLKAKN
jgi:hypothetical protein